MKRFLIFIVGILLLPLLAFAQDERVSQPDAFYRAEVAAILDQGVGDVAGVDGPYQTISVEIRSGILKGRVVEIDYGKTVNLSEAQLLSVGQDIIVGHTYALGAEKFYITDSDRTSAFVMLCIIFFGLAVIFGRKRGFTAIGGLIVTFGILAFFVFPKIINGAPPFTTILSGAFAIAVFSIYMSHGFRKTTTIAVVSTLITLTVSAVLAYLFGSMAYLTGMGSEETFYLLTSSLPDLDFRGLLYGGIIIGALGVLDDITTAQVAVVQEIKHANQSLGFKELYRRAIRVGQEHIASLINTLVLAYVGAAFPLLLLFVTNKGIPLWVVFNSELVFEEVVRTFVGSIALVLAVPIATSLAALYFNRHDA